MDPRGLGGVLCPGGWQPPIYSVMVASGDGPPSEAGRAPAPSTRKRQHKLDRLDPTKRSTIHDWLITFRSAAGPDFTELFEDVRLEAVLPSSAHRFRAVMGLPDDMTDTDVQSAYDAFLAGRRVLDRYVQDCIARGVPRPQYESEATMPDASASATSHSLRYD